MNNIELYNLAKKYLGTRGADARSYCGLPNGAAWCCAFVTWIFYKGGDRNLFYGGSKVVYCPTAISWCRANLAQIPIYLSIPMDIIFFDWQPNGTPDHIGFVKERKSDQDVYTIEGNTSGGIVAEKVRPDKYVCGCFRPAFPATWKDGALTVDGYFGYNSIAMLQKALKSKGLYSDSIDGILGKNTVKAVQKLCGVAQDGSWGVKTSKAMQRFLGVTVDGAWGMASTKALQTWINKTNGSQPAPQPTPKPTPTPSGKLVVDGKGGVATVKAMQRFFGTTQDGVISGQNKDLKKYYSTLESVSFGKGGSLCIQRLQKWVGANQDGVLGQITVKLWQKKIGVQQSGYFGAESMKKWQTYLNEHDKATYPTTPSTPSTSSGKYIGQATKDYDGKAGDSSGKEVTKSAFKYSSSSTSCFNWTYVFRPKDSSKAQKAATMCEKAIANSAIGYNKAGETAYGKSRAMTKLAKAAGYDLGKITTKCGLSCGDLICLCNHWAGLSTCYIGSGLQLANNYKNNSNFTTIKYTKGMTLKRGDVLITAHSNGKNNHVAMVL